MFRIVTPTPSSTGHGAGRLPRRRGVRGRQPRPGRVRRPRSVRSRSPQRPRPPRVRPRRALLHRRSAVRGSRASWRSRSSPSGGTTSASPGQHVRVPPQLHAPGSQGPCRGVHPASWDRVVKRGSRRQDREAALRTWTPSFRAWRRRPSSGMSAPSSSWSPTGRREHGLRRSQADGRGAPPPPPVYRRRLVTDPLDLDHPGTGSTTPTSISSSTSVSSPCHLRATLGSSASRSPV